MKEPAPDIDINIDSAPPNIPSRYVYNTVTLHIELFILL